jgi:hypothetical protein
MTFALPAIAADDAVKASMKQADSSYDMTKKQAKADEKSALAQCDTMSGDAKSQCKKDAEAMYKKTMADAEARTTRRRPITRRKVERLDACYNDASLKLKRRPRAPFSFLRGDWS